MENKLLSSAGSDVHSSPEFYHFNIDPECTFNEIKYEGILCESTGTVTVPSVENESFKDFDVIEW